MENYTRLKEDGVQRSVIPSKHISSLFRDLNKIVGVSKQNKELKKKIAHQKLRCHSRADPADRNEYKNVVIEYERNKTLLLYLITQLTEYLLLLILYINPNFKLTEKEYNLPNLLNIFSKSIHNGEESQVSGGHITIKEYEDIESDSLGDENEHDDEISNYQEYDDYDFSKNGISEENIIELRNAIIRQADQGFVDHKKKKYLKHRQRNKQDLDDNTEEDMILYHRVLDKVIRDKIGDRYTAKNKEKLVKKMKRILPKTIYENNEIDIDNEESDIYHLSGEEKGLNGVYKIRAAQDLGKLKKKRNVYFPEKRLGYDHDYTDQFIYSGDYDPYSYGGLSDTIRPTTAPGRHMYKSPSRQTYYPHRGVASLSGRELPKVGLHPKHFLRPPGFSGHPHVYKPPYYSHRSDHHQKLGYSKQGYLGAPLDYRHYSQFIPRQSQIEKIVPYSQAHPYALGYKQDLAQQQPFSSYSPYNPYGTLGSQYALPQAGFGQQSGPFGSVGTCGLGTGMGLGMDMGTLTGQGLSGFADGSFFDYDSLRTHQKFLQKMSLQGQMKKMEWFINKRQKEIDGIQSKINSMNNEKIKNNILKVSGDLSSSGKGNTGKSKKGSKESNNSVSENSALNQKIRNYAKSPIEQVSVEESSTESDGIKIENSLETEYENRQRVSSSIFSSLLTQFCKMNESYLHYAYINYGLINRLFPTGSPLATRESIDRLLNYIVYSIQRIHGFALILKPDIDKLLFDRTSENQRTKFNILYELFSAPNLNAETLERYINENSLTFITFKPTFELLLFYLYKLSTPNINLKDILNRCNKKLKELENQYQLLFKKKREHNEAYGTTEEVNEEVVESEQQNQAGLTQSSAHQTQTWKSALLDPIKTYFYGNDGRAAGPDQAPTTQSELPSTID
jgi:hypothetical protein